MNATEPKSYASIAEIDEGGCYEERDGRLVRVQEPTGPAAPPVSNGADAGPGAVVGATSGEPQARAEADEPALRR